MHDEQDITVTMPAEQWRALLKLLEKMWFPVEEKILLDRAYFTIEERMKR